MSHLRGRARSRGPSSTSGSSSGQRPAASHTSERRPPETSQVSRDEPREISETRHRMERTSLESRDSRSGQPRGGRSGQSSGRDRRFDFRGGRGGPGGDFQRPPPSGFPETESFPIIYEGEVGTGGRKVELISNHFKMQVKPMMVYHYDINFDFQNQEEKAKYPTNELVQKFFTKFATTLFEQFLDVNRDLFANTRIVYDNNKNVYCTEMVDTRNVTKKISVKLGRKELSFNADFKMVQEIDLSKIQQFFDKKISYLPPTVIHFLELLLQNVYTVECVSYGRKYFRANRGIIQSMQNWISFVRGFSHGVRITQVGLTLNLHNKTACIISPSCDTLLELVCKVSKNPEPGKLRPEVIREVNTIIKGLKIFTDHTGTKNVYTIRGLTRIPKSCTFTTKDGEEPITVHDYFFKRYNINLKDYPAVEVSGKRGHIIPLELCKLVEKQFLNNQKVNREVTSELLHKSTLVPIVYLNTLSSIASEVPALDKPLLDKFGTSISVKPLRLSGRVLESPKLIGDHRNDKFYRPLPKPKWVFFSFDPHFNQQAVQNLVQDIQRTAGKYNLDLSKCEYQGCVTIEGSSEQKIVQTSNVFLNVAKRIPECKLVVVVIPNSDLIYRVVKHVSDQKLGIPSQCMNSLKIKSRKGGYLDNLLLKINGKMGGQNSIVDNSAFKRFKFNHEKTMVIGIDVNHPGETERVESSIAAAVGSYDKNFTMYSVSIHVQRKNNDEMIGGLEMMTKELLQQYEKKNGYLPETLFVFRDGISDGQFLIAENEIRSIKTAFRQFVKNGKVIFIIVQKAHQTRFVLREPQMVGNRQSYNVPPGTVVDTTIVDPSLSMFFLNSHFSALGTSRPMKYVILHNDFERSVLSFDDIQRFTYLCCHNCTRVRGSIALPTAVRYAHLCAYRSKLHIEAQYGKLIVKATDSKDKENFEKALIEKLNDLVEIHNEVKPRLYYA